MSDEDVAGGRRRGGHNDPEVGEGIPFWYPFPFWFNPPNSNLTLCRVLSTSIYWARRLRK